MSAEPMTNTAGTEALGQYPLRPPLVHFNHAGAGLTSRPVVNCMKTHLEREATLGPMEAQQLSSSRLEAGYDIAARFLGVHRDEIAFGGGHGQLWGNIAAAVNLQPGDRILVSRQEWVGNLIALHQRALAVGAIIETMPFDDTTAVDVGALRDLLDNRVKLVSLTWIAASGGLINPAAEIGQALAGSKALYMIDASQAIGQLDINVPALGCDVLVGSGRKFLRGPRGSGIAYVRRSVLETLVPPVVCDFSAGWNDGKPLLRNDARRFETAEYAPAVRLGFISALNDALELDLARTEEAIKSLANELRTRLASIDGVKLRDLGQHKAGLITFTVAGFSPAEVKLLLAERNITIAAIGRNYTPIDFAARGLDGVLRASVHLTTSAREIESLVRAIAEIAASSRTTV